MSATPKGPAGADLVRVPLVQDDRAPAQARRVARDALLGWRLPGLVDAVVLTVSELVTNAVRYGRPPVGLELRRGRAAVRVRVHDGEPAEPAGPAGALDAGPDAESGRGLLIVEALAGEVWYEQVPDDGKIVAASFGIPEPDDEPGDEALTGS